MRDIYATRKFDEKKEQVIKAKSVIIKGIKEARASLNNTNNNSKQ